MLLSAMDSFSTTAGGQQGAEYPGLSQIQLYHLQPIYTEERDMEMREGTEALMRAFAEGMVEPVYRPGRPNLGLNK